MRRLVGVAVAGAIAASIGVWAQQNARPQGTVPDGDWRTINRNPAADRYSPLRQITAANVASLREAWTFRMAVERHRSRSSPTA